MLCLRPGKEQGRVPFIALCRFPGSVGKRGDAGFQRTAATPSGPFWIAENHRQEAGGPIANPWRPIEVLLASAHRPPPYAWNGSIPYNLSD
jgi:hypothetical protein